MASSSPTTLHTPDGLLYPITITRLRVHPDDNITRGLGLCDYSFQFKVQKARSKDENEFETRYGTWESPIEGVFGKWLVRPGDVIASKAQALKDPAATIM